MLTAHAAVWGEPRVMRAVIIAAVLATSTAALADDDCRGDDTWSEQCSVMWPQREGRKPASFAIGWASEAFDPSGTNFEVKQNGTLAPVVGHVSGSNYGLLRGNGFYVDVRVHPTRDLYVGVSCRAAFLDTLPARVAFAGMAPSFDSGALIVMAGLAGARIPLGPLALRGELVAGIHGAELSSSMLSADGGVAPLLEPRVAIDVRLGKFTTLEAYGGENILARDERVFGIGLGVHLQAFDGRY